MTYGPVVTEEDVRTGFETGLKLWLPAYLAEVGEQHGRGRSALPVVASWHTAPDFDVWPEDHLPAVVIIAPGLADTPNRGGDGTYYTRWAVMIGCVVQSRTRAETMTLAGMYAAAIRTAVMQQPSAMGTDGVGWVDEGYTELPSEAARTLVGGMVHFAADIVATLDVYAGPVTVPSDPHAVPSDSPSVTAVAVGSEPLT